MQKIKSLNWSGFLSIIKCCMIGILTTLIGLIIFAVILKFVYCHNHHIVLAYQDTNIIYLVLFPSFLKSIFAGLLYAVLSLIVFAILNKGFSFNLTILYDILFALIVSVIVAIIINLLHKKNA